MPSLKMDGYGVNPDVMPVIRDTGESGLVGLRRIRPGIIEFVFSEMENPIEFLFIVLFLQRILAPVLPGWSVDTWMATRGIIM